MNLKFLKRRSPDHNTRISDGSDIKVKEGLFSKLSKRKLAISSLGLVLLLAAGFLGYKTIPGFKADSVSPTSSAGFSVTTVGMMDAGSFGTLAFALGSVKVSPQTSLKPSLPVTIIKTEFDWGKDPKKLTAETIMTENSCYANYGVFSCAFLLDRHKLGEEWNFVPGTTYYLQASATDNKGHTVKGKLISFVTSLPHPAVSLQMEGNPAISDGTRAIAKISFPGGKSSITADTAVPAVKTARCQYGTSQPFKYGENIPNDGLLLKILNGQPIPINIINLTPNTKYSIKCSVTFDYMTTPASVGIVTVTSSVVNFNTPPPPPVITLPATNVTATSVTLNGGVLKGNSPLSGSFNLFYDQSKTGAACSTLQPGPPYKQNIPAGPMKTNPDGSANFSASISLNTSGGYCYTAIAALENSGLIPTSGVPLPIPRP